MRRSWSFLAALLLGIALIPLPAPAMAQHGPGHAPGHGGGSHVAVGVGWGGYYGYPYAPYYPGYSPFYFGYYGWYPYWYASYPPPWAYGIYDDTTSIKLEVKPKQTEVYVDGYRAGIVDEFDGLFQRMRLRPGEHELVLYLEGYRTVRQTLRLSPGNDLKIKHTMVPLAAAEPNEPRPEPPPQPAATQAAPPAPVVAPSLEPRASPSPAPADGFGAVTIRVQPADAEVWIDGEQWSRPSSSEPLVVQLAPGTHRVEIRKTGYVPFATDVDVQPRRATPLNVSLPRERQ